VLGGAPALASGTPSQRTSTVIEELHIRGLGVIEDVSLVLSPGLTVVTGETGAGKTMIVTALELLLGARSSADLVRRGSALAAVEAVLSAERLPGSTEDVEGALIVGREVPAEGRSRARVDGRLVPVSALQELLGGLVEVHGQHEHIRLERPAVQRAMLDRFAGEAHARRLTVYRERHSAWRALQRRKDLLHTDARERARRIAQLQSERDEIDALHIDVEVDGRIDADLDRLMNADELRSQVDLAVAALGADAAGETLAAALTALRRAPVEDAQLTELVGRLGALSRELSELTADLASYGSDVEADAERLDTLQLRKRDLTAVMRRFGASLADVLAFRADVATELGELLALEEDADGLDEELELARLALVALAEELTQSRRSAGDALARIVDGHLAELGLEHARFTAAVEVQPSARPGPDGMDDVVFLLAANPGEPATRLGDGASGGERSRVALAIEVALAEVDDAAVLVFDEVDAGVGGSTAIAVGEKLARLAHSGPRPRQVLCVTHLAQVAAFADVHHVVEKQVRDGRTVTSVRRIEHESRVDELSRMLGGEATAEAGLDHARRLLEAARERVVG
jgi:DNA repair protein RecN (Recombination protein N)